MKFQQKNSILGLAIVMAFASSSFTVNAAELSGNPGQSHIELGAAHAKSASNQAQMPRTPQTLPPSVEQIKFSLPESKKDRKDLLPTRNVKKLQSTSSTLATATNPDCQNMDKLATYNGTALADYIVNLPDYECHYGLFSLSPAQAAKVYSSSNFAAVANRFVSEAAAYNANNIKLVNLLIYLRAGYYLAGGNTIPEPSSALITTLRPAIAGLLDSNVLYQSNAAGPSTAGEVFTFITNMHDEVYYLPRMKSVLQRFTNSSSNPKATDALNNRSGSGAMTGALTVLYFAHYRTDSANTLKNDHSYPQALYNFIINNKTALIGGNNVYQLTDAEREAFRFMQYSTQFATVKPMLKNVLATTSMDGVDSAMWLAAANSVDYYDAANCAEYGTCNFKTKLADKVLKYSYTCSPSLKIRAQDMTTAQLQDSCAKLATEESYFHRMMQTKNKPVADDFNSVLELVIFDDYSNYDKYASIIYGINTNNGGMYLEGNPATPGNQARFIAHEASWLRPAFSVWNLEHEYVHYLDGRFNMYGDFGAGTTKPTVWYIEGLGEYLSLKNNNQKSIDVAKTGTYKLSTIFGNTYSMNDYVTRAYRWGYMATRFMNERHRSDLDFAVAKFRTGDYNSYQAYMENIGQKYDAEFASWVQAATTAGEPPLPAESTLPACSRTDQLGKNCSISGYTSTGQAYSYIILPTGAKNLRLYTSGGTGDVNLWVAAGHYPSKTSGDPRSTTAGSNEESVRIANPVANTWYYIMLDAKKPFSNVTLSATYE